MVKSRFFINISLVVFGLMAAGVSAQDDGSGLVFTGCPPYVEGNHCDSMYYQVVAVDIGTGKKCPEAKYFIVSGPGEIDQRTGLWVFHPELEDLSSHYWEELEIAAYKGNDTTTSDENCRFQVRVYDQKPRFDGYCGAHISVLPGDTIVVPLEVTDEDDCHDPEVTIVEVHPTPSGWFDYDEETRTVSFAPAPADSGLTYEVAISGESGPSTFNCRLWFECREVAPVKIRIESVILDELEPGDTVSVDLVVDDCPVNLDRIDWTLVFDDDFLEYLNIIPGKPFFDPVNGCDWSSIYAREAWVCNPPEGGILMIRAAGQGGYGSAPPICYRPTTFPAILATLQFVVTQSLPLTEQFIPIDFYWCRCHDNLLWSPEPRVMFSAAEVMNPEGRRLKPTDLPGYAGTSDECFYHSLGTVERYRNVWYRNGGVRLKHPVPDPQYSVRLGVQHDQLQGHFTDLPITLETTDSTQGLGGFDLLVGYDASALAFQLALEGDLYDSCGWEYFTYRYGGYSDCGTACPSGMLRVVGLAETNNGPYHPGCDELFPGYVQPDQLPITLVNLRFLVSNDRTLAGTFVPVSFFWYDCTDNILYNRYAGNVYLSARVFDANDSVISVEAELPTWSGAPEECVGSFLSTNRYARQYVDYYNGGIGIQGCDTIDFRGDINLNGIPWEIADAVMFTNYFINGTIVFGIHVEGSIAASDCNGDGISLSVADLVFMARVGIGDAPPCLDAVPSPNTAHFSQDGSGVISVSTPDSLGAVYLVIEGEVVPTLMADSMEMIYGLDSGWTRILVYSFEANEFISAGPIIAIPNTSDIIEVSTATFTGCPVVSVVDGITDVDDDVDQNLPTEFALGQNYPNPFNPSTMIEYDLPKSSIVRLEIYNITGQIVRSLVSGQVVAGHQSVTWDGRDASGRLVSSGIYLYRLSAGEFVQTRKMMLLK